MKTPRLSLVASAVATMFTSTAFAGGVQQIEKVDVVASALALTAIADTASEGTILREQIENRPRSRIGEVLEVIPGLIVTQHSGDGKANQYFLRGFNLDHGTDFRTSVNGVPVNMPTHAHGQGYTDLNFVIPELINKITYKKGTYHAEEGDFSAAGAANIEYVRSLKEGLVSIEGGQDSYIRSVAAKSFKAGAGDLLFGAEVLQQDGPWDVPENTRKRNAYVSYAFGQPSNQWTIAAMAYNNRWTATDQVPQSAVVDGEIGRFGSLDPTTGGKTSRYSITADWKRITERGITRANAYMVDYKLNLFSNFTYWFNDPINGDQFEQADRRKIYGANIEHAVDGSFGKVEMTHAFGVNLRFDDIDAVGLYATAARKRLSTVREDRVKQTSSGVYYKNTAQWTPTFRTIAGLRSDFYRADVKSDLEDNSGKRSAQRTSPKLSAVFGPFNKTEFFASYGYGFHSNDARGATIRVDPATGEAAERVQPLVRAKGSELGVRTQLIPHVQTSLALWRLDLDSELVFVGDAGTTEASRPSRRTGVEFANYWTPLKGLTVDVDVAWAKARFRDEDENFEGGGRRIPGAIERTASAGVTYENDKWFAGFRGRYFGPRPLIEDNSVRSSSSTLANLKLGYKPSKNVRLSLDVLNVFDKRVNDIEYFYESRRFNEPPNTEVHFHPTEPRTVRATLSVKF